MTEEEAAAEIERRDEIIATTTKLWKDAETAIAEARMVIKPLADLIPGGREGLDDGHRVLISQLTMGDLRRAVQWTERNP